MLRTKDLLFNFSGTGPGPWVVVDDLNIKKSVTASVSTGTAVITIQVANAAGGGSKIDFVELVPAAAVADGFIEDVPCKYMRAVVVSSGGIVSAVVAG